MVSIGDCTITEIQLGDCRETVLSQRHTMVIVGRLYYH